MPRPICLPVGAASARGASSTRAAGARRRLNQKSPTSSTSASAPPSAERDVGRVCRGAVLRRRALRATHAAAVRSASRRKTMPLPAGLRISRTPKRACLAAAPRRSPSRRARARQKRARRASRRPRRSTGRLAPCEKRSETCEAGRGRGSERVVGQVSERSGTRFCHAVSAASACLRRGGAPGVAATRVVLFRPYGVHASAFSFSRSNGC